MIAQEAKKHKLTAQIGQERGKRLHQFVGNLDDCTRSQQTQTDRTNWSRTWKAITPICR